MTIEERLDIIEKHLGLIPKVRPVVDVASAALAVPAPERGAFLNRACGDHAFRAKVEAFMRSNQDDKHPGLHAYEMFGANVGLLNIPLDPASHEAASGSCPEGSHMAVSGGHRAK